MDSTPWKVKSKRRKSIPSVLSTGRKRQRQNETPLGDNTRQQTLTQAQWMSTPSASFVDGHVASTSSRRPVRNERLKRDSTLTQMDFFARSVEIDTTNSLDSVPEIEPIPQLDGPYQSPRRPRQRKTVSAPKIESTESQEYQPHNKSRKIESQVESTDTTRRSSRRLADQPKVLSDPAENFHYFNKALGTVPPASARKLVIQDSTAETDIVELTTQSPPKTPRDKYMGQNRPDKIIPSSQTPDSLPSTLSRSTAKRPLREISYNARAPPSTPDVYQHSPFGKRVDRYSSTTSLKRQERSVISARGKVDDSQSNLWSIQATSSPRRASSQIKAIEDSSHLPGLVNTGRSVVDPIEVPSTSQPDPGSELAEMHGTVEGVFGDSPDRMISPSATIGQLDQFVSSVGRFVGNSNKGIVAVVESCGLQTRNDDLAQATISQLGSERPIMAVLSPQVGKEIDLTVDEVDSDSNFGSPIRNDTQFDAEVKDRISSPVTSGSLSSDIDPERTSASPIRPSVHCYPPPASEHKDFGSSKHSVSLPPAPSFASYSGFTTTRVLLNDMLPPSSPPLPSTKSVTQRSVRPASMPHPSQVSTQEATQGYLGSSFMPMETPRAARRITIKDSSSVRVSMSQIPPRPATQSQLSIDLGLGESRPDDQDQEEYDLDPPTLGLTRDSVQQPHSVSEPLKTLIPTEAMSSSTSAPSPLPNSAGRGFHATDNQPDPSGSILNDLNEAAERPSPAHDSIHDSKRAPRADIVVQPQDDTDQKRVGHSYDEQDCHDYDHHDSPELDNDPNEPHAVSLSPSIKSSPPLSSHLARPISQYTPLPGFNNETQSNFTQGGHVSAAYVHKQREKGVLPKWYVPKCVKVPGYTRW